jgi:hypothetical protein
MNKQELLEFINNNMEEDKEIDSSSLMALYYHLSKPLSITFDVTEETSINPENKINLQLLLPDFQESLEYSRVQLGINEDLSEESIGTYCKSKKEVEDSIRLRIQLQEQEINKFHKNFNKKGQYKKEYGELLVENDKYIVRKMKTDMDCYILGKEFNNCIKNYLLISYCDTTKELEFDYNDSYYKKDALYAVYEKKTEGNPKRLACVYVDTMHSSIDIEMNGVNNDELDFKTTQELRKLILMEIL